MKRAVRRRARIPLLWVALALAGCAFDPVVPETVESQLSAPAEALSSDETIPIDIASNGWHSAIFFPRRLLPKRLVPEAADFPSATWLGFGWGDAAYFPAREPTIGTTLRAALLPTPAVIQLSGLSAEPKRVFPQGEIVRLTVSRIGFSRLADYIDATFKRDGAHRSRSSGPGLDPFSLFYAASGEFHLFNTCNSWTAGALAAAGLPVDPSAAASSEDLMAQVREIAAKQRRD